MKFINSIIKVITVIVGIIAITCVVLNYLGIDPLGLQTEEKVAKPSRDMRYTPIKRHYTELK